MAWEKTKNLLSVDPADTKVEKNLLDTNLMASIWGKSTPASSKEDGVTGQLLWQAYRTLIRRMGQSGWRSLVPFTFSPGFPANSFRIGKAEAFADGLPITDVGTSLNSETESQPVLPAPPGAGVRDDLVYVEVFLVEVPGSTTSAPTSVNKPSTTTLYKYGNVLFGGTNPTDDINEVNFEIRRRVQMQYRVRTVAGINFTTYPKGINDPLVLAQGPNASPTAIAFAAVSGDAGLFRAGAGTAAHQATLGTLDGYVYAIPIAKVARSVGVTEIQAGVVTDLRDVWGGALSGTLDSPQTVENLGVVVAPNTPSANMLRVSLAAKSGQNASAANPATLTFRSPTQASGLYVTRSVTAALLLDLSVGSTLAFTASETGQIGVYALDNAGTVELAVSRALNLDESRLQTTIAEGGSGGADAANVLYSATARSNVAIRLVALVTIQGGATPGNWPTAASSIQLMGVNVPTLRTDLQGHCRLTYVSATQLRLDPHMGKTVPLKTAAGWRTVEIPAAGWTVANTSVFVNGTSGQNLAAGTGYLLCLFDNAGVPTFDFRTTLTHAVDAETGVEILVGDPTRTVIGLIRTNSSSQFADSATQRFVRSWFNDPGIALLNQFTATRSVGTSTVVEINSEIRVEFVAWSGEIVMIGWDTTVEAIGGGMVTGAAFDSTTVMESGTIQFFGDSSTNPKGQGIAPLHKTGLADGYHYATLLGRAVTDTQTQVWRGGSDTGGRTHLKVYARR